MRCRAIAEALTLANQQKLAEWVREARKLKQSQVGRGGNEGVVGLMGRFPFPFLREVTVPEQLSDLNPGVPLIFMMTSQGTGSGLETSRRLNPGGDLDGSVVFIDGTYIATAWLLIHLSTYDHIARELRELCKGFVQTESKEALGALCAKWKAVCQVGNVGEENNGGDIQGFVVAPSSFMLDAAAGPIAAVEEAFEFTHASGRGTMYTCRFHFGRCRGLVEKVHLKEELVDAHKNLTEVLFHSKTEEEFMQWKGILGKWYREHLDERGVRGMESWLNWWQER